MDLSYVLEGESIGLGDGFGYTVDSYFSTVVLFCEVTMDTELVNIDLVLLGEKQCSVPVSLCHNIFIN